MGKIVKVVNLREIAYRVGVLHFLRIKRCVNDKITIIGHHWTRYKSQKNSEREDVK
jgi:hypothetical protein